MGGTQESEFLIRASRTFWVISHETIILKNTQTKKKPRLSVYQHDNWHIFSVECHTNNHIAGEQKVFSFTLRLPTEFSFIFPCSSFHKLTLFYMTVCLFLKYWFPLIKGMLHRARSYLFCSLTYPQISEQLVTHRSYPAKMNKWVSG